MQRRYATADVFTAKPLGGNPVAVVLGDFRQEPALHQDVCQCRLRSPVLCQFPRDRGRGLKGKKHDTGLQDYMAPRRSSVP